MQLRERREAIKVTLIVQPQLTAFGPFPFNRNQRSDDRSFFYSDCLSFDPSTSFTYSSCTTTIRRYFRSPNRSFRSIDDSSCRSSRTRSTSRKQPTEWSERSFRCSEEYVGRARKGEFTEETNVVVTVSFFSQDYTVHSILTSTIPYSRIDTSFSNSTRTKS